MPRPENLREAPHATTAGVSSSVAWGMSKHFCNTFIHLSLFLMVGVMMCGVELGMLNGRLGPTPSFASASLLAQVWCPT